MRGVRGGARTPIYDACTDLYISNLPRSPTQKDEEQGRVRPSVSDAGGGHQGAHKRGGANAQARKAGGHGPQRYRWAGGRSREGRYAAIGTGAGTAVGAAGVGGADAGTVPRMHQAIVPPGPVGDASAG